MLLCIPSVGADAVRADLRGGWCSLLLRGSASLTALLLLLEAAKGGAAVVLLLSTGAGAAAAPCSRARLLHWWTLEVTALLEVGQLHGLEGLPTGLLAAVSRCLGY
ncbi:hypothetical protein Dimus_005333 [Dionaea muscipula]